MLFNYVLGLQDVKGRINIIVKFDILIALEEDKVI